jgi:hypothetical protein
MLLVWLVFVSGTGGPRNWRVWDGEKPAEIFL